MEGNVVKVKKYLSFFILLILILLLSVSGLTAQRVVDKNKGDHNQTRKGFMDGNLAATVYYNFGEIADWENEPSRSGVWPKGTNHTYIDGVAIIVQAEAQAPDGTRLCRKIWIGTRKKRYKRNLAANLARSTFRLGWNVEWIFR
jgi:hypothetical protein